MVFWLNSLVDYFLGKFGDVFLLTLILGETSAASLYDISYSLTQAVLLAATVGFAGLSFARFSRLAREGRGEMNRFYISLVRTISFLTIPAFAFLLVHAASLIAIIYSPAYGSAAVLLQTMAGFRIASRLFAGGENAEYLLSRGRVAPLVAIGVLAAGVNVGLDILLIPAMRAEGAAIAGGSANLLVNGLGWLLVRKAGGPRLQGAFWLKLALMSAVCAGVSYILLDGMLVVQAAAQLQREGRWNR